MNQLIVAWTLLVSAVASGASAQTTAGGSIRGYVTDEQKALLVGVQIVASSGDAPTRHAAATDDSGFFRLLDLPPGTYTLTATRDGFATYYRGGVVVRAGLNLSMDIEMKVGAISETVEIRSFTPLLESQSSTQAVNVSGRLQRSLPLNLTQGWDAFMLMMPGVTTTSGVGGSEGEGAQLTVNVRAANFDSTVVQLDGARIDSAYEGGTWNIHFAADSVQDTQVKLSGVDASVPLGLGGSISVAAKSGTNRPTTTASFSEQPEAWGASNEAVGTPATVDQTLADVSGGAPIVMDRLWFFGSYRFQDLKNGIQRSALQVQNLTALQPGFVPFANESIGNFYFAKITAQLAPTHQLGGFYEYDAYPNDNLAAAAGGRFQHRVTGGPALSGRWTSTWGQSLTTSLVGSYTQKRLDVAVLNDAVPAREIWETAFKSGGVLAGSTQDALLDNRGSPERHTPYNKFTLSADATYLRNQWLGMHQIRTGFYLEAHRNHTVLNYYNNGFITQSEVLKVAGNPAAGTIPFSRTIYDQGGPFETTRSRGRDAGTYIQDDYHPTSRLTLNLGVRVDWMHYNDDLFDVNVQSSTEVGPRLGLNYQLTRDGRNVVTASWTRVHDQLFRSEATVGSTALGFRTLYDVDLDGTFETTIVTPAATRTNPNAIVDPNRHQPYVDEWNLFYQRQLPSRLRIDVGFDRRTFEARQTSVEVNGIYENGIFKGYRNESLNNITLLTNNAWNQQVYTDTTVSVSRQSSRLNLLANYTRQWRHLEGTWQPNDPPSFIQPNAFPNDRGLGTTITSDLGYTSTARPFWRDHVVHGSVAFVAPWNLLLATTYNYQSGPWSGPIITRLPAPDPAFGPSTITLSNGRVVSNPLATPVRYKYATRGDGQFHLAGVHVWNVRAGREFAVGRARIQGTVDVFNVINAGNFYGFQSTDSTSPLFGQGASRQPPRSAQVGIRVTY